jgi:hypothetical protein
VTSSSGGDGATLDSGSPDFPVAGGCEGKHIVLEVEAVGGAAPTGGGNGAAASGCGAIDGDARCPTHGCRGGGDVDEEEGEGEGEPGKGGASANNGGGAEEPARRRPLRTTLGQSCNYN